jgi:hypothetical protein
MSVTDGDLVDRMAKKHSVSPAAVQVVLAALRSGGGRMAQFSHADFGGMSQWSPGMSAAASSAFLAHAPALDDKDPEARSPATEKFYSVTQRMPLKTLAMRAWSEAVLNAYLKAGGVWPPRPYEAPIKKYSRSKRIKWKLGVDIIRICIQNGAPFRIKPRTHMSLILLYNSLPRDRCHFSER